MGGVVGIVVAVGVGWLAYAHFFGWGTLAAHALVVAALALPLVAMGSARSYLSMRLFAAENLGVAALYAVGYPLSIVGIFGMLAATASKWVSLVHYACDLDPLYRDALRRAEADRLADEDHRAQDQKQHDEARDAERRNSEYSSNWSRYHDLLRFNQARKCSPRQFEEIIAQMFRNLGWSAELTARGGDQGADIVLSRDGRRVAVQVKQRSTGAVENAAVMQVRGGAAFYKCNEMMVITNAHFTRWAYSQAEAQPQVQLISGRELCDMYAAAFPEPPPDYSEAEYLRLRNRIERLVFADLPRPHRRRRFRQRAH